MPAVISYILSAIFPLLCGAIVYFIQRHFKQHEKRAEEAEERRTQKDLLVLKSLKAIGELCIANAVATRQGHANGELTAAQKDFEAVDKELNDFILKSAAQKVNKR